MKGGRAAGHEDGSTGGVGPRVEVWIRFGEVDVDVDHKLRRRPRGVVVDHVGESGLRARLGTPEQNIGRNGVRSFVGGVFWLRGLLIGCRERLGRRSVARREQLREEVVVGRVGAAQASGRSAGGGFEMEDLDTRGFEVEGEGLILVGLQNGAAQGAGGVRVEPHVDALEVEAVAALGQRAPHLVLLELPQADGAFQPVSDFGRFHMLRRLVPEFRQRFHRRLAQAHDHVDVQDVGVENDFVARGSSIATPPDRPERERGRASGRSRPPDPFGINVQANQKENDGEEDRESQHHNFGRHNVFGVLFIPELIACSTGTNLRHVCVVLWIKIQLSACRIHLVSSSADVVDGRA